MIQKTNWKKTQLPLTWIFPSNYKQDPLFPDFNDDYWQLAIDQIRRHLGSMSLSQHKLIIWLEQKDCACAVPAVQHSREIKCANDERQWFICLLICFWGLYPNTICRRVPLMVMRTHGVFIVTSYWNTPFTHIILIPSLSRISGHGASTLVSIHWAL